ncbi:hypothetical protein LB467_16760 [Salegentibacter sp. JZCK2]|uniref:PulJ/GspJ family protein n=1 Tax=Salegentibacter tibetensis TaxID=2873600 RepID=UPI001CCF8B1B|nr:hypothetical protein [Salegentibacter tibetensis]MBZ9731342.1 hypothetical protein [Salegentibacter tibetensis]
MRNKNKIPAFTLNEILVVLVISAIVVGMAFSVLDLVQSNLRSIKNNYSTTTEVQHIKQQLTIDFNKYHDIRFNGRSEKLHLRNPRDSVSYTFPEHLFLRDLDTVPVSVQEVQFFFLGNIISEGKVDAVKILLGKPSGSFIFISKKNDAKTYFD